MIGPGEVFSLLSILTFATMGLLVCYAAMKKERPKRKHGHQSPPPQRQRPPQRQPPPQPQPSRIADNLSDQAPRAGCLWVIFGFYFGLIAIFIAVLTNNGDGRVEKTIKGFLFQLAFGTVFLVIFLIYDLLFIGYVASYLALISAVVP